MSVNYIGIYEVIKLSWIGRLCLSAGACYAARYKAHVFPAIEVEGFYVASGIFNDNAVNIFSKVAEHPDFKHFTVHIKITTIYNWI